MRKIKPTGTKVLIEFDEVQTESEGGFQFSEKMQKGVNTGKVISVGPGVETDPMRYRVGEHVMFTPNANSRFSEKEQDFIIIEQNDICAYVEE